VGCVHWDNVWSNEHVASFAEHVLSGAVLALVAVLLAVLVTNRSAAERAETAAQRERDLTTARDLYQVAGQLFAAWKLWDFHSREPGGNKAPYDARRHSEIIQLAASAEGQCESLLVRIAQEHKLDTNRIAALWCLRTAFKELRRSVREGQPLKWWASDFRGDDGHRAYNAYKSVLSLVGAIVEHPAGGRLRWYRYLFPPKSRGQPTEDERRAKLEAIKMITGHTPPLPVKPTYRGEEWILVAELLTIPYSQEEDPPESEHAGDDTAPGAAQSS
jgi:hypothetical protein